MNIKTILLSCCALTIGGVVVSDLTYFQKNNENKHPVTSQIKKTKLLNINSANNTNLTTTKVSGCNVNKVFWNWWSVQWYFSHDTADWIKDNLIHYPAYAIMVRLAEKYPDIAYMMVIPTIEPYLVSFLPLSLTSDVGCGVAWTFLYITGINWWVGQ